MPRLAFFIGFTTTAKALTSLMEDYNEDLDENKFSKLMKLDYIDHDFADFEHFGKPSDIAALTHAVESKRERFNSWGVDDLLGALKATEGKADAVNALVCCGNEYSPWELKPFTPFKKGKSWFMFITTQPNEWGGEVVIPVIIRTTAKYKTLCQKVGLEFTPDSVNLLVLLETYHLFGERYFTKTFGTGQWGCENDSDKGGFNYFSFGDWFVKRYGEHPMFDKVFLKRMIDQNSEESKLLAKLTA